MRNAETPIERKPPWIKTKLKMGPEYKELKALVEDDVSRAFGHGVEIKRAKNGNLSIKEISNAA